MKVLFLATVFEYGGLSSLIKNILDNLDREKFDIVFLVESLAPRHYPLKKDIKFINMDIKPAKGPIRKLVNIFRHLYRIRKAVIYERPDVVMSFGFNINCLYLLSFLWPAKDMPKTVLGEYTEKFFVKGRKMSFKDRTLDFMYKIVMAFLYHRADTVVCVSHSLARHIGRFFLMDSKKVKVIHIPVNIKEIQRFSQEEVYMGDSNNSLCVGTISRLSSEKGINYLIEACSDLAKRLDVKLVIVGEGGERHKLEEMAKDFNIEDKVTFLGWIENPYKYLKKMDVFVLSSLWEGFPTSVVESMVCGVPVVATRSVGGMQELIEDGVDGLLVPSRSAEALADSIYALLQDKELRGRLVREASKKIEQFDSGRITQKYESVLLDLFR